MRRLLMSAALLLAVTTAASAAPFVTGTLVANPTLLNLPFTVEDFGTGGPTNADGKVTGVASGLFTSTGVEVLFGGTSGVYVGDVSGKTRSPFREAGGSATDKRYLNARAGTAGGSITLKYGSAQTAFNLLWGSVDVNPATYNQLTFTFTGQAGSEVVSGSAFAGLAGLVSGTSNLAVSITNLQPFDTITVTASQEAFEFAPGVPVPEPGLMLLLGLGLVGAGARLRRRQ